MCEYTPSMRQYLDIKADYKDALLYFRMGEFYEMFFDDAIEGSKLLSLTLTSRFKRKNECIPMVGFPSGMLNDYILKAVRLGKKVAICEQFSSLKKGGLIERRVVALCTPGTVTMDSYLVEGKNNFITCVYGVGDVYGVSSLDLSTGCFFSRLVVGEIGLFDELDRVNPAEILLSKDFDYYNRIKSKYYVESINSLIFNYKDSLSILKKKFSACILSCVDPIIYKASIISSGTLCNHLINKQNNKLKNVIYIEFIGLVGILHIDSDSRKNLELFKNFTGGEKNTLFNLIDFTSTSMGRRLLRQWLSMPVLSRMLLNDRLDAVSALKDSSVYSSLCLYLSSISDIERILCRISNGTSKPFELKILQKSLSVIPNILLELKRVKRDGMLSTIFSNINEFDSLVKLLDVAIEEKPSAVLKEGCNIIKRKFDSVLDKYKHNIDNKDKLVNECQKQEQIRFKKNKVKISFNQKDGFFIDIKNSISVIPDDYIHIKTLSNRRRYISKSIVCLSNNIKNISVRCFERESKIYNVILYLVKRRLSSIQNTAVYLSQLDVLNSLAKKSSVSGWCKPKLVDDFIIEIKSGRHPVIENKCCGEFISNDLFLDKNSRIFIITGANMGGKSTYMRQIAIITLLAHIGSHVPAASAIIGSIDKIFTRIGATDDLANDCSTFMLEMKEMSSILRQVTDKSLVIIDEIGRGTGYLEGKALAYGILKEFLLKKAFVLFSTHFYDLSMMSKNCSYVKDIYFKVIEKNRKLIFFYKWEKGSSAHSFALNVARIGGISDNVIDNASKYLIDNRKLEFNWFNEFFDFFKIIDPDRLSPRDALEKLYLLKEIYNKKD